MEMKRMEEVVSRLEKQLNAFEIIAEGISNSNVSSAVFLQLILNLENIVNSEYAHENKSNDNRQNCEKKTHQSSCNNDGKGNESSNNTQLSIVYSSNGQEKERNDLDLLANLVRRQLEAFRVLIDATPSTSASPSGVSHHLCAQFIENIRNVLAKQPQEQPVFMGHSEKSVDFQSVDLGPRASSSNFYKFIERPLPSPDPSVICSIPIAKILRDHQSVLAADAFNIGSDSLDREFANPSKRRKIETNLSILENDELLRLALQVPSLPAELEGGGSEVLQAPPIPSTKLHLPMTADPDLSLQNDLVLLELFKYIPTPDLVKYRLVSTQWKDHATTILLRRKSIEIKFCYSAKMKKFFASTLKPGESSSRESLATLNNRIKKSKKFPCNNFYFKGGNMAVSEVQDFFKIQGGLIKKLKLELTSVQLSSPQVGQSPQQIAQQAQGSQSIPGPHGQFTSITTFRHMLLSQLPLLEDLTLKKFPNEWKSNFAELFPEPAGSIALPRLRVLQISRSDLWTYTKIMGDILRAAVNLQKIEGLNFELKTVDVFLLGQKIHMIKSITYYGDQKCIFLYEKFAGANPKLKQIQFDMEYFYKHTASWPRVTNTVNMILESSRESLEEIVVFNPIGFLPSLVIPRLENLRNLVVEDQFDDVEEDRFRRVFPMDFNLADKFPQLQVFTMNLRNLETISESWEDYFPDGVGSGHPVPSVKRLEIGYQLNASWLEKLNQMFPLVTRLEMQRISNFPEIAKELWNFPKLRKAKFEIEVGGGIVDGNNDDSHGHGGSGQGSSGKLINSYPALDAAFTGFAKTTVVNLKELSRTVDLVEVENLRVGPSILHLKDLKLLWIRFSDVSNFQKSSYPAFLSHVTPIFGFKLIAGLRVKVSWCAKEPKNVPKLVAALEAVSPFVEFVHDTPTPTTTSAHP